MGPSPMEMIESRWDIILGEAGSALKNPQMVLHQRLDKGSLLDTAVLVAKITHRHKVVYVSSAWW